jgi:hypothetical protein
MELNNMETIELTTPRDIAPEHYFLEPASPHIAHEPNFPESVTRPFAGEPKDRECAAKRILRPSKSHQSKSFWTVSRPIAGERNFA